MKCDRNDFCCYFLTRLQFVLLITPATFSVVVVVVVVVGYVVTHRAIATTIESRCHSTTNVFWVKYQPYISSHMQMPAWRRVSFRCYANKLNAVLSSPGELMSHQSGVNWLFYPAVSVPSRIEFIFSVSDCMLMLWLCCREEKKKWAAISAT